VSLSVIVPTKTRSNAGLCLRAIGELDPGLWRIVIDDGVDFPPPNGPSVPTEFAGLYETVVPGIKPFIFSRAVNMGIVAAGSDDCIVTNDDAILRTPGGFTLLQKAAREHPEFGVIGAVTNITGQPLQHPHGIGLREVPHIAFVCVLIPRRTIDRVGLLDERYCIDYGVEDLDYCEASRRAGLKVGVFDHCYVDHGSLTSSFRGDPSNPRSFARNKALFDAKWGVAA
jgi:GT2 family glycosyltransferase